jgi:excisionase family DNA binding protein
MSKRERDIYRLAHTISEVVNLTGVGRSVLYEQIGEGRLRIRKLGRRTLIFDTDLKAWLESLPEKRPA